MSVDSPTTQTPAPSTAQAPRYHEPEAPPNEVSSFYYRTRVLVRIAIKMIGRLDIQGRENVPETGAVIIASNHRAHVDPPYISSVTDRQIFYMAKEELFTSNKLMRRFIERLGAFPVRRGEADRPAIRFTLNLLKEGRVVCIFPEGTRSFDTTLLPPEKGFALIAKQSGAAIVPVAIENTQHVLPKGTVFMHRSPVSMTIGKPVTAQEILDSYDGDVGKDALDIIGKEVMRRISELMRIPG